MMNAARVARHYAGLTAEERFRLILAASGRGDEAERDRLARAAERITISMQDHAPYAHAFDDLTRLIFIELLEDAVKYLDAFALADDVPSPSDPPGEVDEEEDAEESEPETGREPAEEEGEDSVWLRYLDLALAAGFMLKTKADGWKLFCERLTVPPFLLWEGFPGFDRLQRALKLTERGAFVPEGMVRWLNRIRPDGAAEAREEDLITPENYAAEAETVFRARVDWWGGPTE